MFTDEELWTVMKAFFENGIARQHIESYNRFVRNKLQEVIDDIKTMELELRDRICLVKFGKIYVGEPEIVEVDGTVRKIYPNECRIRNLTYSAPLYLDITFIDGGRKKTERVHIGNLPIMVKSDYCLLSGLSEEELIAHGEDPKDPGGYFIINGSERVIVALEDLAPNRILVEIDRRGVLPVYRAKVFSSTVGFRAGIEVNMKPPKYAIEVSIPGVPTPIPFVILMKALGVRTDREIAELVSPDPEIQDELEPSFERAVAVRTIRDAILFIGNRVAYGQVKEFRIKRAEMVIDRNLFPHLGKTPDVRRLKAIFLAEMARRIIELKLGRRGEDDKDHLKNKRVRLSGELMAELFRLAFWSLYKDMKYQFKRMATRKKSILVSAAVRPGIITMRMQHALATGNWKRGKVGMTQLLDRTNTLATLSHLRRVQSLLSRGQPNFEARELHPTHWGKLCPNETPEGANCGLVKNLALMASISEGTDPKKVEEVLYELGVVPFEEADEELRLRGVRVFLDGMPIGFCTKPVELVREFRQLRRRGRISHEANIAYYKHLREIYVNCDEGRIRRPLLVVNKGKLRLKKVHIKYLQTGRWTWRDLVKRGIVEFLDAEEEENAYIALNQEELTPEHTHMEICPYTILGVTASIIPYAEHNHSPRNSYEAAMAKQAAGLYAANFFERCDTRAHLLHYPQKPLVVTKPMEVIGFDDRPVGQNFVVAVLTYRGYNMEDAIVFNKASIERGLGHSTFFRIYKAERRHYLGGARDEFTIPEPGIRGYHGSKAYRFLEADGLVAVEAEVGGGDVLIGRTSPPRFLEEFRSFEVKGPSRRDTSISMRPTESGVVDTVFVTETAEGTKLVKVKVRSYRVPEIGDKFASRHGQKGVIGLIVPQEDMPFSVTGVVPDIIINPHAMPSRMTVGQFFESIAGKVAALRGRRVDGTPFSNEKPESLMEELKRYGFRYDGRELFYDGITGEKFEADVFVGVVYYQKLHHMVADKIHARARGQVQMLTRQPTEGRARGGGLRFGEMERDCLIGHGAAMLLKDRLLEESDKYVIYVCKNCGQMAYYDVRSRRFVCRFCGDRAVVAPVTVSYAFKLLLQELLSLCIKPQLRLSELV